MGCATSFAMKCFVFVWCTCSALTLRPLRVASSIKGEVKKRPASICMSENQTEPWKEKSGVQSYLELTLGPRVDPVDGSRRVSLRPSVLPHNLQLFLVKSSHYHNFPFFNILSSNGVQELLDTHGSGYRFWIGSCSRSTRQVQERLMSTLKGIFIFTQKKPKGRKWWLERPVLQWG